MPRVVAVTGTTGFIGRRLVAALAETGFSVRDLGRTQLDLTRFSLADVPEVAKVLGGADTVCHVAAHIPKDHRDPAEAALCMQVNALATLALLEASAAAGVRHFVYFSSGNVYRAQDRAVTEEAPIYPSARAPYYLASKVCGELFADHFGQTGRLSAAIARVSSVYGPGMLSAGMVPKFASVLRGGGTVQVQDGGRYRTDLVHVDDVVDGVVRLVTRGGRGAFNFGAGRAATTLEVAQTLALLLQCDEARIVVEAAGPGPVSHGFSALDVTRARTELGYAPRDLSTGLQDYLDAS